MLQLRPFQHRFLAAAFRPGVRTAALSIPRGNGKSSLVAWLAKRALTPGDALHVPGSESHIVAASVGQARRTVFKLLKQAVEEDPEFHVAESTNNCHVDHRASKTRISVLAANGRGAQGLVGVPFVFADEPGAWAVNDGQVQHEAIQGALSKPGCKLRVIYIGTLAPATGGWWHDLVHGGSDGSTHVTMLQADPDRWDHASEIRRVNPLMWRFPESRSALLEERDKARADTRLAAAFKSYRLNLPSGDEATTLLTVADWQNVCGRPVPEANGTPPVVGVDLGQSRAWSSAVAVWPTGRTEAVAVAPGVPTIAEQEKRDLVPAGTYQRLVDDGLLLVADGLEVPNPATLTEHIGIAWRPRYVLCDFFRLKELRQCIPAGVRVLPRRPLWSHAAEDIRALRRLAKDGPLSCDPASRPLIQASLSVAKVENDQAGNTRLVKSAKNRARDDVCAALLLAAGGVSRMKPRKPVKAVVCGAP